MVSLAAMILPKQVRAARALLGISQEALAERAGVGVATVRRLEATVGDVKITVDAMLRIQRALEHAGIDFIDQDTNYGPGVRLRRPSS